MREKGENGKTIAGTAPVRRWWDSKADCLPCKDRVVDHSKFVSEVCVLKTLTSFTKTVKKVALYEARWQLRLKGGQFVAGSAEVGERKRRAAECGLRHFSSRASGEMEIRYVLRRWQVERKLELHCSPTNWLPSSTQFSSITNTWSGTFEGRLELFRNEQELLLFLTKSLLPAICKLLEQHSSLHIACKHYTESCGADEYATQLKSSATGRVHSTAQGCCANVVKF